jgi:ATP-dependent protease ClpP protease subunit
MKTQVDLSPTSSVVFGIFSGPIDSTASARLFKTATMLSADRVTHLHLLFQSNGGPVGDGICLYNVLARFPMELTLYNAGAVRSIAAIAYLGAQHRKVSTYAAFMIHRSSIVLEGASTDKLAGAAQSLSLEDARIERILRQHLRLTPSHWDAFRRYELMLSAQDAIDVGFADAVAEFAPPAGAAVLTI